MALPKQRSREILAAYQKSGASWQAVERAAVYDLLAVAVEAGRVFTEGMALTDLHYWINAGDLKAYRYLAQRWRWEPNRAYRFINEKLKQSEAKLKQSEAKPPDYGLESGGSEAIVKQSEAILSSIKDTRSKIPDHTAEEGASGGVTSGVSEGMSLPLQGGGVFVIKPAKIAEWASAYPGVDVRGEIRRAVQWCKDNPKRAPKSAGNAFVGRWLSNARATPPAAPRQATGTGATPWLAVVPEVKRRH